MNSDPNSTSSPTVCGGKTRPGGGQTQRKLPILLFCSVFCLLAFVCPRSAHAGPTQEDVFKSIQSNENDSIDGRKLVAVLAAIAGVVIIVVVLNNRQERKELPQTLNHSGKLLRELMKSAGLKNAQIRQLKMLSDELADQNQPVEHLVTLLLCPSLIKKARDRKPK
jgi:hypothetical protein